MSKVVHVQDPSSSLSSLAEFGKTGTESERFVQISFYDELN
jgi:hypothetical protein